MLIPYSFFIWPTVTLPDLLIVVNWLTADAIGEQQFLRDLQITKRYGLNISMYSS